MSQYYTIHTQLYYNLNKEFKSIFIIDRKPPATDSLNQMIRTIQSQKISAFHNDPASCLHALINPVDNAFFEKGQEALLFTYISQKGYLIDTNLTKMLVDIKQNRDLICFISKN